MSGTFTCILCSESVPRQDLEGHIAEKHSDPERKLREVDGANQEITDAEYVRLSVSAPQATGGKAELTVVPVSTVLDEIGVKLDDCAAPLLTIQGGGVCTAAEAKLVIRGIEEHMGWRINRASFIINFLAWGFNNSFTEEVEEAGGFEIEPDTTVAGEAKYVQVATLQAAVTQFLENAGTGRKFTLRRFGRFLAPSIITLMAKNEGLGKFSRTGTPASRHFAIPDRLFLTATSIFPDIKEYESWSNDERKCFEVANRAAKKQPRAGVGGVEPTDLRIDPSEASTMHERGLKDYVLRHSRDFESKYGKGADIFGRMARGQTSREGLSFE